MSLCRVAQRGFLAWAGGCLCSELNIFQVVASHNPFPVENLLYSFQFLLESSLQKTAFVSIHLFIFLCPIYHSQLLWLGIYPIFTLDKINPPSPCRGSFPQLYPFLWKVSWWGENSLCRTRFITLWLNPFMGVTWCGSSILQGWGALRTLWFGQGECRDVHLPQLIIPPLLLLPTPGSLSSPLPASRSPGHGYPAWSCPAFASLTWKSFLH